MLRLFTFFFLSVSLVSQAQDSEQLADLTIMPNDLDSYSVRLEMESAPDGQLSLIAYIELETGSYFISPYSADRYKGSFKVKLKKNEFVEIKTGISEKPQSIAALNACGGGMANIVDVSTEYAYELKVNSTEDFKVLGMIEFVIEPKCSLEEIPFSISRTNGKITVQRYPKLEQGVCTKKI